MGEFGFFFVVFDDGPVVFELVCIVVVVLRVLFYLRPRPVKLPVNGLDGELSTVFLYVVLA